MPPDSSRPCTVQDLFRRTADGIRPGLEVERALLDRLERPEDSVPAIHVAGTNGKGSVCALLEAALRAAGIRTGLYTSPHLVRFHERFRVNGACIGDRELAALIETVGRADARLQNDGFRRATFFEYATAMALLHFAHEGVQVAILETGMGGRWDATNVITPLLSVLTRIDLDHTNYLGLTREAIAVEKAGIIKTGRPVVCGAMPASAARIMAEQARLRQAPLIRAEEEISAARRSQDESGQTLRLSSRQSDYGAVRLPLIGRHQIENAATAAAALEVLETMLGRPLVEDGLRHGWSGLEWPARCQVLSRDPLVLLDGAHNPSGAGTLAATLRELDRKRPWGLVLGFLADKDVAGCLAALARAAGRCWTVPVENPRALPPQETAERARTAGFEADPASLKQALSAARRWASEQQGRIAVAGSLSVAGDVLRLEDRLPFSATPDADGKAVRTTA